MWSISLDETQLRRRSLPTMDNKNSEPEESEQEVSTDFASIEELNATAEKEDLEEEENEKEWELEEDVLRFLKTVSLHRCVTGTPNSGAPLKLLDDILLVRDLLRSWIDCNIQFDMNIRRSRR